MQKSTTQLDIFDTSVDTEPSISPEPALQVLEPLDADPEEEVQSLCLSPSAGIQECRECWERHPELWARYVTRANCVRHTR